MEFGRALKEVVRGNFPAVNINDTLEAALKKMASENTPALLVKQAKDLAGIITISDILYSLAKKDDPQNIKVSAFMTGCELISDKTVKTPCVQLDEDEDLFAAIKLMNEAGVNYILISGSQGKPAGLVSSLEVIKQLVA